VQRTESVVPISISMPPTLAWRIRVLAARQNKSRSQFVREVLENVLPSPTDQPGAARTHQRAGEVKL